MCSMSVGIVDEQPGQEHSHGLERRSPLSQESRHWLYQLYRHDVYTIYELCCTGLALYSPRASAKRRTPAKAHGCEAGRGRKQTEASPIPMDRNNTADPQGRSEAANPE